MKTKNERKDLGKEDETLRGKPAELNADELMQVSGGFDPDKGIDESDYDIEWKKNGEDIEEPIEPGEYNAALK